MSYLVNDTNMQRRPNLSQVQKIVKTDWETELTNIADLIIAEQNPNRFVMIVYVVEISSMQLIGFIEFYWCEPVCTSFLLDVYRLL